MKGNLVQLNWLYDARVLTQMDACAHILYYGTLQPIMQPARNIISLTYGGVKVMDIKTGQNDDL